MHRHQKEVSSDISHKLGLFFEKTKDLDKAQQHFADALKANDSNEKVSPNPISTQKKRVSLSLSLYLYL